MPLEPEAKVVPKFLSDGWLAVSARVGRQPTIDYANCVLFNFALLHPAGGVTPHTAANSVSSHLLAADRRAASRRTMCESSTASLARDTGLSRPHRTATPRSTARVPVGLLDEEWFLKTHVIIESEAAGVVSAVYDAAAAVRRCDLDRLLAQLTWLEQAYNRIE